MNLKQKTLKGITWSGTAQLIQLLSHFIVTAILARLLEPGDFGLIGMANVFINIIILMNERGWSNALIQNQDVEERHFSSVFWINIAFSFVMMGGLIFASPFIAEFYGRQELRPILVVLSFTFALEAFGIVQRGIHMKELNFKKLAIVDMASFIFSGITGIYLALHGYGVWSLVYQIVSLKLVSLILLWCFTAWKPKFLFSLTAIKELFYFSMNITAHSIMTYVSGNADYFLIGKFLGAEALGFYTLAFKLMMVPTRNISWVVSKVTFPVFSKIQHDLGKVRQNYLKVIKTLSLITFPLIFVLFVVTPEFVRVVVGLKWEPAILLIRILCICGLVKALLVTWGSVALSQGRSDLQLRLGTLGMIIFVSSVCIGLPWGILGVVVSYTVAHIFWLPYVMNRVGALIDLHLKDIFKLVFRGIGLSTLMMSCLFLFKHFIALNDFQGLIFFPFIGIIIYSGVLWIFEATFVKNEFIGIVNIQ